MDHGVIEHAVPADVLQAVSELQIPHASSGPQQFVVDLLDDPPGSLRAGETLQVGVSVDLAGLEPGDVRVECVVHREMCSEVMVPVQRFASHGPFGDGVRELDGEPVFVAPFEPAAESAADGSCKYHLAFTSPWTGAMRYEIRAVPQHPALLHPYETGLMRWL